MSYPTSEATVRPYRLWDANAKQALRWRCYKHPKRAHLGALVECRWAKVGVVIEVFNANNGRLLGQYKRTPTSVEFSGA